MGSAGGGAGERLTHSQKEHPSGALFARKFSETVSDELCKVSQKQQHKTFCMWLEKVKKDFSYFQWLNLHLISL